MKKAILLVLVLTLCLTAEVAKADFTYGKPTNLGPTVNSSSHDGAMSMSADGLSIYFDSNRSGGYGEFDIWVTSRSTTDEDWGIPVNLGSPVNTSAWDGVASISADGLSLYFSSSRPGGYGDMGTWFTTRTTTNDSWGEPVNLGPTVNSSAGDWVPSITSDELTLFFSSLRSGGSGDWDLWVTCRETKNDDWDVPVNLGPTVNSSFRDWLPSITPNGLTLFFTSNRPGGYGSRDIWVTKRATKNDSWSEPVNLGPPFNTQNMDQVPIISADGSTVYFNSDRAGGFGGLDIWQVSINPIIDLNGDGIVDSADMCIIVDNWHTDNTLCDIAPAPFGDGFVDVQDLIVLAEHLFEDVDDPTLINHWALDEVEGITARDSVTGNEDFVMGNPLWQPTDGKVDGALELDGIDDCIISSAGPNTAEGPFSVVAWIKGGAPGQVVISQPIYADWLAMDAEGRLMTELKGGRDSSSLLSEAVITDGQWHRIGLVWDGTHRLLFVDGVTVAEDTLGDLAATVGGLYIGVGKNYAGTFFSGLIDDVRIYNRAVSP